jgi:hypothetical protein
LVATLGMSLTFPPAMVANMVDISFIQVVLSR